MDKRSTILDIIFNYTSLLIGGVSGILINIYISYFYGPEGLGIFNQIYAIYIILSQLSVGGIHLSALKYVATWQGSSFHLSKIAWSSFFISLPVSGFFASLCYVSSFFTYLIFPSVQVSQGIRYAAFALVFFSCNKVMLFTLNALRNMRLLAFWQGVRFILMVACVIILTYYENNAATLGLTFTLSEGILFIGLFFTNLYKVPHFQKGISFRWMKIHFLFGLHGLGNGLLLEINTRVDILLLGILTNDLIVGLYSFASMLIEGMLGLLVVIRNQINPILANILKDNKNIEIRDLFKKTSFYMYFGSFFVFIIAVLTYDPFFSFVLKLSPFLESRYFFLILLGGICLYSAYLPFDNILLLSGYPGKQSLLALYATLTNIILNICFIPIAGAYGAAIATALSMFLTLFYLRVMVKKYLQFSL